LERSVGGGDFTQHHDIRDRSITRTMNSCVFISVDGVSTRKDAPIKTIKYYQTWGCGSGR
jgi:hypothetical protein